MHVVISEQRNSYNEYFYITFKKKQRTKISVLCKLNHIDTTEI